MVVLDASRVLDNFEKAGDSAALHALDHLVELVLVLDDHNAGARVDEYVRARLGRVGRVDAASDAAGKDGADERHEPLGRVEADDGHALAALKAELQCNANGTQFSNDEVKLFGIQHFSNNRRCLHE